MHSLDLVLVRSFTSSALLHGRVCKLSCIHILYDSMYSLDPYIIHYMMYNNTCI